MEHESLKEWKESHQTSNPKLAKKHGVKLREEHEKGESKLKEKKEHLAKKMHGKMKEKWTEGHKAGSMSYLGKK